MSKNTFQECFERASRPAGHPRQENIGIRPLRRRPLAQIQLPAVHFPEPMLDIQAVTLIRRDDEPGHVHRGQFVEAPFHEQGADAAALVCGQGVEGVEFWEG